jgi:hypothetical protein
VALAALITLLASWLGPVPLIAVLGGVLVLAGVGLAGVDWATRW